MTAEQERLVVDNMAFVPFIVNKYFPLCGAFERQDLYSIGYIALCKAARDFGPERGFKFSTLASKYIRAEILNEIRKTTRECRDYRNSTATIDRPIDTAEGKEMLGNLIPSVDTVETIAEAKLLLEWLDGQDDKDAKIVRLHVAGYVQSEIAVRVGLSQSLVSRKLTRAKERIKEYYAIAM